MNKTGVALAFVLLIGSLSAANWTDDGHGGVYWTENGYTIRAYPATSNELINHYQYVNFTSTNPASIMTNLSFVFDQKPLSGDVLLWQNKSHQVQVPHTTRMNSTYQINGVASYTASTLPCQIGDAQNIYNYNVSYNTTSIIACFDNYTNVSNNYTITYSYNGTTYTTETQYWMDWGTILNSFTYTNISGHHIYTINDVPFNGTTNYQTKFLYSFPASSSGKFDIYAHRGSPAEVIAYPSLIYVQLDPWWNSTWGHLIPFDINTTVASSLTNFPAMVNINTSNSTLWNTTTCTNVRFLDSTNTSTLNYDLDSNSSIFCGNATNNATFWVSGNYTGGALTRIYAYLGNVNATSGENKASTWGDYESVWHFSEASGNYTSATASQHNMTEQGTITRTSTNCPFGSCFSSAAAGYLTDTIYAALNSPADITMSCYANITGLNSAGSGTHPLLSNKATMDNWLLYDNSAAFKAAMYSTNSHLQSAALMSLNMTYMLSGRITGNVGTVFINGSNVTSPATFTYGNANGNCYHIGANAGPACTNANERFRGTIDECRISFVNRTNDWITAEYAQFATIGAQESAPLPTSPPLYIKTEIVSYNGTNITYNFTGIVINNGTTTITNTNVSLWANNTLLTSIIANITTGQIYTISTNWAVARPTLDNNFTASVNTSNTSSWASGNNTAFMILPIDPPSAINLMSNGGKNRCRTPQDVGYWDGRDWNINASWNCNYTNLNLTSTTETTTTKGTYASFLYDNDFTDANNASDGSYATKAIYASFASNSTYWNYTNLANSTNQTTWQTKHGNQSETNTTLPALCANQTTIQLKITANNSNSTATTTNNTGYKASGTITNSSLITRTSTVSWLTPSNATNSDDLRSFTSATISKLTTPGLYASNFNFNIPAGATITGITVIIERQSTDNKNRALDDIVSLVKNGALAGSNYKNATKWDVAATAVDENVTYGTGTTDLWGTTWTVADMNNASTGVILSVNSSGAIIPAVDMMQMRVYYNTTTTDTNYSQTSKFCYDGSAWQPLGTNSTATNNLSASDIYEQDVFFNSATASGNFAGAGIKFVDSGTTTFSNSTITAHWFNRLAGDLGTAAIFIFKAASQLWIR